MGPFKYYVIKILTFLDPTHLVCNQNLLIERVICMLLRNHLAYPTPLDYVIFEWFLMCNIVILDRDHSGSQMSQNLIKCILSSYNCNFKVSPGPRQGKK